MASGPIISLAAAGGFDMQQVLTGDVISIADFNDARNNINRLLGAPNDVALGTFTPASSWGYNQGGAGVGAAVTGQDILATGAAGAFKDLQDDVQALCAFLGQALRPGVGTDVVTGNVINSIAWRNLMLNVEDCWNNRFVPASRTTATLGSTDYTIAWTNSLTQETTWNFTNETNCRAFFNAGGVLGFSGSRTGGTVNDQNTSWTNIMTNLSDVWLFHDTCSAGAGTTTGIGFYELTTSYQNLVVYNGPTSPYSGDNIVVSARVNSTTNPTQVFIRAVATDAGDNAVDESPDGTFTFRARRQQPDASGSGFSIFAPTPSVGAVSGS